MSQSLFAQALKDHQLQQAAARRELEKVKRDAVVAVEATTNDIVESINRGVMEVYENQQRLEQETKLLQASTDKFAKHTSKWLSMYKGLNASLKELGDVKNWAQVIERDMIIVADTLEQVVRIKQQGPAP